MNVLVDGVVLQTPSSVKRQQGLPSYPTIKLGGHLTNFWLMVAIICPGFTLVLHESAGNGPIAYIHNVHS